MRRRRRRRRPKRVKRKSFYEKREWVVVYEKMSGIKEEVPPTTHQTAPAAVVSVDAIKNAAIVGVLAVAVLVVGFFCCRGFWRYFSHRWTEYWSSSGGGGRRKKVVEYEEVDDDGDGDDDDDEAAEYEDEVPAAPARRKRQPATRRR